jgi:hypothetical protein
MIRNLFLILISILVFEFTALANVASAGCELDDITYYIKKKGYNTDKIRDLCRNKVDGLENCTLYKIIRLVKEGKPDSYIIERCQD